MCYTLNSYTLCPELINCRGLFMSSLSAVVRETGKHPDAAVIWLHGLGADGHDFAPIVPQLGLPADYAVRFIFPHAPVQPVTLNGGMSMPSWYDIRAIDIDRDADLDQLQQSSDRIQAIIDEQIDQGIASERIIVAGFSQGGAVAFHTALSCPHALGGLLALSTYLASEKVIQRSQVNQNLPVLIQHGTRDPVVPEVLGRRSAETLRTWGYPVHYETWPIEHNVCAEQVERIGEWLTERFSM